MKHSSEYQVGNYRNLPSQDNFFWSCEGLVADMLATNTTYFHFQSVIFAV